jgi:hypothetical protein
MVDTGSPVGGNACIVRKVTESVSGGAARTIVKIDDSTTHAVAVKVIERV